MKKKLTIALCAFMALVLACVVAVYAVWSNEIATLFSFRELRARNDAHLDGAVYEMKVKGDYYLDEFVAQGGVSNDTELIDFVVSNITKGIIPVTIKNPEIGCSSFTARTEGGAALFARNYDMVKTNTCIVITEPGNGRHASVSTADLGLIGINADSGVSGLMQKITCLAAVYAPLDGMNDAGVACGVYMTYQGDDKHVTATDQNTDKPDFTTTTFLRMVLDYADNIDEAIEIAMKYDMHDSAGTSYHYMVADASGRSAVLEWVAGDDTTDTDGAARDLIVHYNDTDSYIGEREAASSFQWLTNFIINPGYYDNGGEPKGLDRYDHMYKQLKESDGVVADEAAAMDILASVGRRTWNPDNSGITVHSAVFNLTDLTVYWVPNENYENNDAMFVYSLR